jgi:hypothetical protein
MNESKGKSMDLEGRSFSVCDNRSTLVVENDSKEQLMGYGGK